MAEKEDKPQLHVQEDQGGGAVVHVPEGFNHDDDEVGAAVAAAGGAAPEAGAAPAGGDDHPADDPADAEQPTDTDAVREAKRERRRAKRALARTTSRERDLELQQLRQSNRALEQRLAAVEQQGVQQNLQQMDRELSDASTRVEYAKMRITQAAEAGDAQAMAEAQEALLEAKTAQTQLQQRRQQAAQTAAQSRQPQQPAGPDLTVRRHATRWAERNAWFDPSPNTADADSRVARAVDQALTNDGFDPRSQDFWDEFDARLRKYLPHRYTAAASSGSTPPRNTVGSSGREAAGGAGNGKSTFVLSPDRVKAIKDSGAWDNPERRNRMIQRYMQYDRDHRS